MKYLFFLLMALGCMDTNAQTNNLSPTGNVGIGLSSPLNIFQVNSLNTGTGSVNWIAGNFGGQTGSRVVMGLLFGTATIGAHTNTLNAWANLSINPDGGNVGIGTSFPSERLSVNGSIRAREIKVETTGWPDFVFQKSFVLPDLEQTEKYILGHGHLEGIPSAAEVEAAGVGLGELNKKLLQKVEEITLHLIAQNKALLEQKALVARQSVLLSRQSEQLKTLKKSLTKLTASKNEKQKN